MFVVFGAQDDKTRRNHGADLKTKPIEAVEVDDIAIGANDVWPRERQRLLNRLLPGSAVAGESDSLATNVDQNAFLAVQEDAGGNQRCPCEAAASLRPSQLGGDHRRQGFNCC